MAACAERTPPAADHSAVSSEARRSGRSAQHHLLWAGLDAHACACLRASVRACDLEFEVQVLPFQVACGWRAGSERAAVDDLDGGSRARRELQYRTTANTIDCRSCMSKAMGLGMVYLDVRQHRRRHLLERGRIELSIRRQIRPQLRMAPAWHGKRLDRRARQAGFCCIPRCQLSGACQLPVACCRLPGRTGARQTSAGL